MKVIPTKEIENCVSCDTFVTIENDGTHWCTKEGKRLDNEPPIPSWCPLPDAPQGQDKPSFEIWDKKENCFVDRAKSSRYFYVDTDSDLVVFISDDGGKNGLWEHEITYDSDVKDRYEIRWHKAQLPEKEE